MKTEIGKKSKVRLRVSFEIEGTATDKPTIRELLDGEVPIIVAGHLLAERVEAVLKVCETEANFEGRVWVEAVLRALNGERP